MTPEIAYLRARAVRWVDDYPFPGVVEVTLTDGSGMTWTFVDKYPMFDSEDKLKPDSSYPIDLLLACTIVERTGDGVTVSTSEPWDLETVDGSFQLVTRPDQVLSSRR